MPTLSTENLASAADHAACRALIRQGSKSFFAASLLLPAAVREPALALYAFCRQADDIVDGPDSGDPLASLEARLELAYQGRPGPQPADRAFADVITRYAIPRALPQALLEQLAIKRFVIEFVDELPRIRRAGDVVGGTDWGLE